MHSFPLQNILFLASEKLCIVKDSSQFPLCILSPIFSWMMCYNAFNNTAVKIKNGDYITYICLTKLRYFYDTTKFSRPAPYISRDFSAQGLKQFCEWSAVKFFQGKSIIYIVILVHKSIWLTKSTICDIKAPK